MIISARSSGVGPHQGLPTYGWMNCERPPASNAPLYLCCEELLHRRRLRTSRVSQRPRPRTPASRQLLAHRRWMDPRAATRQSAPGIGDDPPLHQHDSEQARHPIPLTAPDAGAHRATDRAHDVTVISNHGSPALAASERMSMRHPVMRAASRAFCPSRPMASDN